ncbi:hypothetical protein RAN3_3599 [plant metagenome]|uniref:Uncharacterized protein n=1 Tax=plant metagenome TaxID=1297885 RepID=A0A484UMQ5_9ZZZZ
MQVNALCLSGLRRIFPSVALVSKRYGDGLARRCLDLLSQFAHLSTLLLIGRRHTHGQQMSERIDGHITLLPFLRLYPS